MPTISIANHKGGCGKTTTAVNLASALSYHRKTVLLIDLDPQGHASLALGVKPDDRATMFDVLDPAADRPLRDVVLKLSATFHLAPSNVWLSAVEQKLSGRSGRERRLRDKLDRTARRYDYLLVDCPPSLGLLTVNALVCSDQVIVPVDAGVFSLQGFEKLRDFQGCSAFIVPHFCKLYDEDGVFGIQADEHDETDLSKNVVHVIVGIQAGKIKTHHGAHDRPWSGQ